MPLTSFDDLLNEQLNNPQVAQLYEQECQHLDAAIAVSCAREQAHLTQEQLAERSGLSRNTIIRIERGGTSPSMKTLGRIAQAMGKQVQFLVVCQFMTS
ncbi:transcriptional regulator [Bifidobacterium pseudolongum subsp. globosum]|uniref:helix-turn-helix transcriptional regulator n=1 Tax=Bifidobacterium pseudolongum TaxID=1694 RepID=UPI001020F303|nr:helix-turn-helix transcriptional regulator [Bifidobacterium pseudolongum]RYQ33105.1 transcriptional regulator [Bifidobacterium pseudolongum subsp. globosum]